MYKAIRVLGGRFAVRNDATGRFTAGTYETREAAQKVADFANGKNREEQV